jgi:Tfp pilus assembly protein PilN
MSAMTDLAEETRLLSGGPSSLPRVNLMPPEVAVKARARNIKLALGGVAVLALVGVGAGYVDATHQVTAAQDQVNTAQSDSARLTKEKAGFSDVVKTYAQAAAAQALLVQAMGQEVRYSGFLNDLSQTVPEKVWITEVTYNQASAPTSPGAVGTVSFSGVAKAHNDVAAWLDAQSKQLGFATMYLQSSDAVLIDGQQAVNWTATVQLTTKALSERYTTADGN